MALWMLVLLRAHQCEAILRFSDAVPAARRSWYSDGMAAVACGAR
jgi:hypothetical protein